MKHMLSTDNKGEVKMSYFIKTDLEAKITKEGKKNSVIGFKTIQIITMGLDSKGHITSLIGVSGGQLYTYRDADLIDLFEYYEFNYTCRILEKV